MKDPIERQAAIQPEQQHGRVFKGVVVEYPSYNIYPEYIGKPYFSIKYTENGQEFIGYGTYSPEVLSEYLKEYFMPSAQPEIIRCKDCKFYSPINRETKTGICNLTMHQNFGDDWFCAGAERRTDGNGRKEGTG